MTQKEREQAAEQLTAISHEAREVLELVEVGLCQILLGDWPSTERLMNIRERLEHALSKLNLTPSLEVAMPERQIEVQLEVGGLAMCEVVHTGQFCLNVRHGNECFIAEKKLGAWREIPCTREPAAWNEPSST